MRNILLFVILCFMSLYGHAYADEITKSETYELQQKLNLLGYNSGNPEGIHSAQMNGYRMDAVVKMCRPY